MTTIYNRDNDDFILLSKSFTQTDHYLLDHEIAMINSNYVDIQIIKNEF